MLTINFYHVFCELVAIALIKILLMFVLISCSIYPFLQLFLSLIFFLFLKLVSICTWRLETCCKYLFNKKILRFRNDHARSTNHPQQSKWIKINIILSFFFQSVVIMKVFYNSIHIGFNLSCFILLNCVNHFH